MASCQWRAHSGPTPFCAPPTPHPFIVNSHFCTGFEPGDVGSHFFFFVLASQATGGMAHIPVTFGRIPRCVLSPAPSAKDFKISVLLLEGRDPLGGRWERGMERCSLTGMAQLSPSMKWVHPPGSLRSLDEIMVELESLFPLSLFGTDRVGEWG